MLEYEWGNPSAVMLEDPDEDPDRSRQFFDNYNPTFNETLFHPFSHPQQSFYDPRYYTTMPPPPPQASVLGLDMLAGGVGYMVVPKVEEPAVDFTARLGLNLGGRTYFSAADEDFVSRLYRRSSGRPGETGNTPRCQAEGCGADLSNAKHYHRRHKVCEYHSKAATVVAGGLTQRFCQQCSRFHLLCEFDNGKRSCRKRLADHNRRRRKSHHQSSQDHQKTPQLEASGGRNSSSDGFPRSPSESVTIAISPPRMSLDCFRGRPYQAPPVSSASSSSSIFFSGG